MIPSQRHRSILGTVLASGSARVSELARELDVTEETIRRDLRRMDAEGLLRKTHGGAVAPETDPDADLPWAQRHAAHREQKRAIARAAAATIEPGEVIALDPSTTACHLARALPDRPLTVVTNSMIVATALADKPRIEVICTGGTLDPEAMAFFGLAMSAALERLRVGRLFFSCKGVDLGSAKNPGGGLSEANDRHAAAKLALLAAAASATLLADTSKLGVPATVRYAGLDAADRVIVESPATPAARAAVARLRAAGADVTEAEPLEEAAAA